MSKKISDEILRLNIVVDGNEAQLQISNLEKANAGLSREIKSQKEHLKKLRQQKKSNTDEYKLAEAQLKKLENQLASNKKEIGDKIKSMNVMDLTVQQLRKRINELNYSLNQMNPNSAAFRKGQEELKALNERMKELRTGSQVAASSLSNLADKFNHYSGLVAAVAAGLTAVGLTIQSVIDMTNKMADAQSAVAKTTGLTNEEVKELTKSFSEFDTRTKRIDLLKIAEIGGRLGVPKQELKEFTREVDKAYVALGDSFSGGVSKVAEKLGKIKGLFKETKDLDMGTAINKIGSSLNELGASGAASEDNIAEFALRVGALPEKLKPTVAEAMALGAAFEESGIDAERSATAYSNFVKRAATDAEGFAKVMRLPVEEVKNLINSDPTAFFLKFSEGIRGLDATEVAAILDELKLNDQYLTAIVGAAAEAQERFKTSIETSNQALDEAISLQKEFDQVNNNAAAVYEKTMKKFVGVFQSEAVAKTLGWLVEIMGRVLGVTMNNDQQVGFFTRSVVALTRVLMILVGTFGSISLVMSVYNNLLRDSVARTIALDTVEKGRAMMMKLYTNLQNAWNLALGLGASFLSSATRLLGMQTVATNLQTVAQARLNAVTSANPLGAVLSVIGLLISAYYTYDALLGDSTNSQTRLNEAMNEATKVAASEISELDKLYKAATDASKGKDAQREAVEKLQSLYPSYFGNMDAEIIMLGKAKTKYEELKDAIIASARARAAEKLIQENTEKSLEKEIEVIRERDKKLEERNKLAGKSKKGGYKTEINYSDVGVSNKSIITNQEQATILDRDIANKQKEIEKIRANNEKANKELIAIVEENRSKSKKYDEDVKNQTNTPTPTSNYLTTFGDDKNSKNPKKTQAERDAEREAKALADAKKRLLEDMEKWEEKRADSELRMREEALALMKEGYEKEIETIAIEELRKRQALEKEKYSASEMAKLDKMIKSEPTEEGKKQFQQIKAQWEAHNEQLTEYQSQATKIKNLKLQAVEEKYKIKRLENERKHLDDLLALKKTEENQEIARLETVEAQREFLRDKISEKELDKIRSWEEGKNAIQAYYQKESLKLQAEYLNNMVAELEATRINDGFLSEEQLEYLENLRSKLAGIRAELQGIRAKENEGEEGANFSALGGGGGNMDIFGLTAEQWELMFTNAEKLEDKILKVGAAIKVAQNLMSAYHSFVRANQEAEVRRHEVAHSRKQKQLEAQLAAGLISQQEYKHATIANENELAMKQYQLELDAAKREKAMKIADTVANTAMAIMSIWSKKGGNPIVAGALTAMVSAMGAVQVATIASQPLPTPPAIVQGAEDGYYPVIRKQDGKLFNARRRESRSGIYDEPTMLVGEQGKNFPELVVSGKAMKRIDPKIQKEFMNEVARVEGFESGLYPTSAPVSGGNDELMLRIISLLDKNIEVMERLEQNGVRGVFEKSARMGKDIEEMQKEYRRLVDKNKH